MSGQKRSRHTPDPYPSQVNPTIVQPYASAPATHSNSTSSSNFRNVSACNRCRVRKNRCDQNLPACSACEKAGVKCVGFDPITKREIPRTYVYYLESRVRYLEELLETHAIPFEPCTEFDLGTKSVNEQSFSANRPFSPKVEREQTFKRERSHTPADSDCGGEWDTRKQENEKINKLVSNIGMVSVEGASDPRFLGSTSGISFARVVAAAIKSAVPDKSGRRSKPGSVGTGAAATGVTSMRDSFFGLSSKPSIKPAPFPDRELGLRLIELYFEHANPQIPILHRGDFMNLFNRAYQPKDRQRSARELYMLNIVFALGAGIIFEGSGTAKNSPVRTHGSQPKQEPLSPNFKKQKMSSFQRQPEEYHASAMMHLESFLGSMPAIDRPEGYGGGLEQLQAVLLLASFALLRPVAPGLWYITGVAVRLAIDLGLHYEDGTLIDDTPDYDLGRTGNVNDSNEKGLDHFEKGRREWVRDLRRRLWWSVYSFDRLVSTCVGRPFGITDQVVTTDWPSILDDKDITPEGFLVPAHNFNGPSYKRVSHHYFRLRLLQSEILQVLQYRQAQRVHSKDRERSNQYMHTKLSSSFLQPFNDSFHAWRRDIDRRLWEWKESAPLQQDTTVSFNIRFLELNYWQAVIMLYRQSLSVPKTFAGEQAPLSDVQSPLSPNVEDHESDDEIYLKVAEAGQRVLKLYRQLHKAHVVNYTYLATVHLFMAGIAFLFSVWHSATVRSRLNINDVKYTVLAGTSVLTDLIDKCPPAEACRDAFDRMSRATIAMCQSTTGFGAQVKFSRDLRDESPVMPPRTRPPFQSVNQYSRPPPTFDYNLQDLFADHSFPTAPTFTNGWQFPPSQPAAINYPSPAPSNATAVSFSASNQTSTASKYDPRLFVQQPISQSQPASTLNDSSTVPAASGPTFDFNPELDLSNIPDFDFLIQDDVDTGNSSNHAPYNNLGFEGGQNDFDDGSPGMPDLFGGFFFGGRLQNPTDSDMNLMDLSQPQLSRVDTILTDAGSVDGSSNWG